MLVETEIKIELKDNGLLIFEDLFEEPLTRKETVKFVKKDLTDRVVKYVRENFDGSWFKVLKVTFHFKEE